MKPLIKFKIAGPLTVPAYRGNAARIIRREEASKFCKKHEEAVANRGCYVFAIKTGGGTLPMYVGKATRTFAQEIFNPANLGKYNEALADYAKATPVIFLVVAPTQRGPVNAKAISELEQFLIQEGVARNPDLLNVRDRKVARFCIEGVIRGGQGKPSKEAVRFNLCMKIRK